MMNFIGITDQYQFGKTLFEDLISGFDVPFFCRLRQYDSFNVLGSFRLNSFNEFHDCDNYYILYFSTNMNHTSNQVDHLIAG